MDDIERMERYLSQIYKECKVDIEKEAKDFFKKYTKQDKQWQKQVADGEKGKDEYQRWRLLHIAKGERFTNIQDHIAETLTNINGIASDYVNGQLPAIYTKHFNALSKSVPVTIDYKFGLVDVNAIKSAVDTNSDFLPLHIFKRTKDFAYQRQSVKDTIIKGIIKGDSIDKMIDELTWLTNVNNSYAKRIVRTAVTATANKGRLDSYKRAEEDGIEIQKQWVATVGSDRTRDWHLELHGQVKPIDEPFENEFGEIMYPGDPNAHPENIYYCRCTMIAKIAGFRKAQVQEAVEEEQEPQRNPVNGKDLVGDIDYSNSKFDYDIETALNAQGFDGLPRVVSNEEFEEALKKSQFYAERTYCAPTQEVLDEYRNQLYNGKWYVDCSEGGAQYGQGMYCAARFENGKYIIPKDNKIGWEMSHYQEIGISKGNKFFYTEGITLTPDAKIFTLYEDDTDIINRYAREYALKKASSEDMRSVIREMIDIQEKIDRSSNSNFVGKVDWDFVDKLYDERARIYDTNKYKDEINKLINEGFSKAKANPGALAAEMGYDAINAQGHGESGSYTVILNRTKCIFREGGSRYGN